MFSHAQALLRTETSVKAKLCNALPAAVEHCTHSEMHKLRLPPRLEFEQRLFWGRQRGLALIFAAEAASANKRCVPNSSG
jgi:hypothetical protein